MTADLENAKDWAIKNLVGKKVYHKEIGKEIIFNNNGISHAIYAKTYPEKIDLIYKTIELLESSSLISIEKDKRGRPDFQAIYKLITKSKLGDKDISVYIIVRETKMGCYFYGQGIIKEKP